MGDQQQECSRRSARRVPPDARVQLLTLHFYGETPPTSLTRAACLLMLLGVADAAL